MSIGVVVGWVVSAIIAGGLILLIVKQSHNKSAQTKLNFSQKAPHDDPPTAL